MAAFVSQVIFAHTFPKPAQLHDRVSALTGLAITIIYWPDDSPSGPADGGVLAQATDWITFQHPRLKTPCEVIFVDPIIFLRREQLTPRYLEWVTIAALIDLGGQCSVTLPWYARLPWRERKWWQRIPR